ncbi:MAG: hypothetical protein FWD36_08775, partial [Treponema sp.]|nr:hypothetical protein [Treponema sp.]
GVAGGTTFAVPWVIGTLHGTIAPFKHTFLELGCDVGFLTLDDRVDSYYSLYPFANLAGFIPFGTKGGFYLGAGGGYMMAHYTFPEGKIPDIHVIAFNAVAGINLWNFLNISYTCRTDIDNFFSRFSNKLSVGFTYRF